MVAADDDNSDNDNNDDNNNSKNVNNEDHEANPCKRLNMQQEGAEVQIRAKIYNAERDFWVELVKMIERKEMLVTKLTRCSGFV